MTGYVGSISDAASNALVKSGVTLDTHVQIDTVAPTVSINTSGGTTNQNVQLISGSVDIGDAGATVNIYDNGGLTPVATTTVNRWPAGAPDAPLVMLASGPNSLIAKVTDGAGNAGTSNTVTFDLSTTAPTVTSLTDATTNGSDLGAGQSVTFTLAASETLTIANGAALTLSNGASAVYNSSTGQFVYTVVAGQDTSDLTVTGYVGSITDAAGNALVKSGVTLDTHVQIDTVAPTVSINTSGGTTNQNVQLISGSVDIGDVGATVNIYDNGGLTPVATTTVLAGGNWSTDVTLASGPNSLIAKVTDGAGNAGTSNTVTFDLSTTAPTVTSLTDATTNGSDLGAGQSVTFTLAASETLTIANGAALTLSNGASAVYNSSTGQFVYTVVAGQDTSDLTVTGYTGAITDGAGNALVKSGVTLDTHVQIDTVAPTVTSLTDTTTNGSDLGAGQSVTFTLAASETLTITNGAALTLSNGALAVYNSSTGKFAYTVQSGDANTSDLTVTGYTGLITDGAGNVLVKSGVTLDTHVQIDTVAPTVTSLTDATTNGSDLGAGQSVTFTLAASETLTIANGAALTLSNGASAVYNSSTGQFVYTVVAGQDTSDLTVTGYTGAITDGAGNALVKSGVTLDTHVQIDTVAPTVTSLTDTTTNGRDLDAGQSVTFTLTGSEALTITNGAALTLSNGASAVYNSSTGQFVYTVVAGQDTSDLTVTGYVGSITDAAGNALVKSGVTLDTHVQIDTVAPTVSINTSGGTTNQNVQLISGSVDIGDVGATVNIYDNGGLTPVATTTVLAGGNWSTDVTLASGPNSLIAKVTDGAGNAGTSNTVTFDLSTTAPTVTSLTDATTNGSDLGAGQSVTFTLAASETLTIANGAALTLSNGASAVYNSGSGPASLTVRLHGGCTGPGHQRPDGDRVTPARSPMARKQRAGQERGDPGHPCPDRHHGANGGLGDGTVRRRRSGNGGGLHGQL